MQKSKNYFQNYKEEKHFISHQVWIFLRIISVFFTIFIIYSLFFNESLGLFLLWNIVCPLAPIVFLLIPGFWRNVCPLVTINQIPREFGFSKALTLPSNIRFYSYLISILFVIVLAVSRKFQFNMFGFSTGLMLSTILILVFVLGFFFKGKSGWCNSFCPMYSIERAYNQAPLVNIPNSFCNQCVGCIKNCYDFNPKVANIADNYDSDEKYKGYRQFFPAILPGILYAFFSLAKDDSIFLTQYLQSMATIILISIGIYSFFKYFLKITNYMLSSLFSAAAINIFYYYVFSLKIWDFGLYGSYVFQFSLFMMTILWLYRSYSYELSFLQSQSLGLKTKVSDKSSNFIKNAEKNSILLTLADDKKKINVQKNSTLLDILENNNCNIQSGCRMGLCGADGVVIEDGMENTSPITESEKGILDRLNLDKSKARMACCVKVNGPLTISFDIAKAKINFSQKIIKDYDKSLKNIIVIGEGISGVTAAEYLRKYHPKCNITIITSERYKFYNRISIGSLIDESISLDSLFLLQDSWYKEHNINVERNVVINKIKRKEKIISINGKELSYDKLIIATGGSSRVPNIRGVEKNGIFSLRTIDDAQEIKAYLKSNKCKDIVIIGAGALGVEKAYLFEKLGCRVRLVCFSGSLLNRVLDKKASDLIAKDLDGRNVKVHFNSEVKEIEGNEKIESIKILNNTTNKLSQYPCDLLFYGIGMIPNKNLAEKEGIDTNRGILVNQYCQTSDPSIYAVGDVAEEKDTFSGLWTIGSQQGINAAKHITRQKISSTSLNLVSKIKIPDLDIISIGNIHAKDEEIEEIEINELVGFKYLKIFVKEDKIISAILIDFSNLYDNIMLCIENKTNIKDKIPDLKLGNWEVLEKFD